MTRSARQRRRVASLLLLMCACVLPGCAAAGAPGDAAGQGATADHGAAIIVTPAAPGGLHGAVLDEPWRVPPVTLVDTNGRPVGLREDTAAALTLVFFGYTNCPDVCGLVLADMASALHRVDPAVRSEVSVLFVTTDPARDSGPVMRTYLDRFDPRFQGLTGPLPRIKRLASALKVPLEGHHRLPSGGYEVGHGAQIIGVSPDHAASVVWTPRTPVAHLASDITALVSRRS